MHSRQEILRALTVKRLKRLARANGLVLPHSPSKARCVAELANSAHTTVALLQQLTAQDLSALCRALHLRLSKRNKPGMIESIVGNSPHKLRSRLMRSLRKLGFSFSKGKPCPPCADEDKENVRRLHAAAVEHRRDRARPRLLKKEPFLLTNFASAREMSVDHFMPRLVEVVGDSVEELLFRYIALHWSIPVSSGYGRRLRFLVRDEYNSKVVGIIGLGDPVFALGARDSWIGWHREDRRQRLNNVMDAFVLGAVPPYASLLAGKLVAMLAASDEVRAAFKRKYGGAKSLIAARENDGELVIINTTSALGRSSIYNRLSFPNGSRFVRVGTTRGYGDFQFLNGLYDTVSEFAISNCPNSAKHSRWGTGFRNRREVVKKCLQSIGLSTDCLYHGVEREIFLAPLAENASQFLKGQDPSPIYYTQSCAQIAAWFKQRWMIPRWHRQSDPLRFEPDEYSLWNGRS